MSRKELDRLFKGSSVLLVLPVISIGTNSSAYAEISFSFNCKPFY